MKKFNLLFCAVTLCAVTMVSAQKGQGRGTRDYPEVPWKHVAVGMPDDWYSTDEAKRVADSVLKYQTKAGGWPKNSNFHRNVDHKEMARVKSTGIGATFDNGATTTEMRFLAKMYSKTKDGRYRKSFMKGCEYILQAQYSNGGWPQFYPHRKGVSSDYSQHITYNDDAMVNIMALLKDILNEHNEYGLLEMNAEMIAKAREAFARGIACILKTQIIRDGAPTVWCAQHDKITLAPVKARTYELPSLSGSESAGIVIFLMHIENPSPAIINAVKGAVNWFEAFKIKGIKLETEIDAKGRKNRIVVSNEDAPAIWARFYDLETGKPFFCDRDGVKREALAEIGYERRNGYSWYTHSPAKVLQLYPEWEKRVVER